MSANKYATLPDIDTAPDIYESEDVSPPSQANKGESSDDEATLPTRSAMRTRNGDPAGREELDTSNLIDASEASKKFRKAEKRRDRPRTHYTYPPSPTSPTSPTGQSASSRPLSLSHRLRSLQVELSALEVELADPSNPMLHQERVEDNVDPGELIRGLVDVRGRLERIRKSKEGRGRLVGVVMSERENVESVIGESEKVEGTASGSKKEKTGKPDIRGIVEMDRRVGELEKLVGTSTTALDEVSPLPPPLLPLVTRLSNQLTLLTQPRHIDSISRRLKLLLSDLDRVSASQHHSHRRQPSQPSSSPQSSQMQEQLLPLLVRLGPSISHIPHILTRLRTLSALHTSASEFQSTLEELEAEQKKTQEALVELEVAIKTVESSLEENRGVVRSNVAGLDGRIDALIARLEELGRSESVET